MPLTASIAASIENDYIRPGASGLLPTVIELAKHYGVSIGVIHRACMLLRDRGLIATCRGRRARIVRTSTANRKAGPPGSRLSAEEQCAGHILEMIQSGTIKHGEMMPKVAFLSRQWRMATGTLCRAYERLKNQGFIHRKGRYFWAGSGRTAITHTSSSSARTILLLHLNRKEWEASLGHHWSSPFFASFLSELSNAGLRPVLAHMQDLPGIHGIAGGREAVRRLVKELGDNCAGILLSAKARMVRQEMSESLFEWINWLVSLKRPVAWFDIDQEGNGRSAEEYAGLVTRLKKTDRFIRCAFNGMAVDALVLSQLAQQGHRSIGLPWSGKQYAWLVGRIAGLRRAAEALPWKLTLTSCNDVEPLLRIKPDTSIGAVLDVLNHQPALSKLADLLASTHKSGARFDRLPDADKELITMIALVGPFLTTHPVTALISLSDRMAGRLYRWLSDAGVAVPAKMSIISYDDRIETLYPYAISSVNFGFDNLAFRGFHALLGDMAIRPDTNRTITVAPRLNHDATLGPAI